ncbi:hypothetical protein BK049_01715 [Bacillus xiamenensis]|uniref:Uncharacterized protein n=1 Tax=Bacillus xiamenensis TaxID=1178537 RepID=A0AAC9NB12_9BACI|nr:hypothetical protein BK049_01715 [Bacillus xiamenensis]MBG9912405.1 hypothetical protein [Bacillus xiamenensis]
MPDDMSFFSGNELMRKHKKEKSHVTLLIPIGIELARTAGGYQLVNILYTTERMFVKVNRAFFAYPICFEIK